MTLDSKELKELIKTPAGNKPASLLHPNMRVFGG